ncbi:zinc-binding alcohol dehydrogenase family protein [Roseibium aggregatum]|uniref:zinc-binding alcohol dehydrogenase family protein n=1 Tax=Roseibium aggregatum TaxID=187304 RepID=UPI001A90556B|nr:zinc-binding alcohol dehydrogenase family protein [Roseibium aggregatum]MBN8184996.1 zinc-binding alcohol dehydrogenase family protein [Roseibium aggregatum]UES44776.1 zinc-binding alcohol dehydrogenase family protein [Roseibium aggregatum]
MRAIGFFEPLPIDDPKSLTDLDLPRPVPSGKDLLVEVKAVAVNPVDTKVRQSRSSQNGVPVVLGYDAAGIVAEVGPDVTSYKVGDEVYYAGDITRDGTNSEYHLIDERIVGRKPTSLSFAEAAAMPLTAITAWEALFDRLKVNDPVPAGSNTLLIIGGSGGVGSIAVQLARQLTNMTIIATASRPESRSWVSELGAHHVLDHSKPMAPQIEALELVAPGYVFSTTHTEQHVNDIAELIAPQGRFLLIDDPDNVSIGPFKLKAISIHWEMMFTRSMYQTTDMDEQRKLLNNVADLVDAGKLKTTLTEVIEPINADNLRLAHQKIESNKTIGKIVLAGF